MSIRIKYFVALTALLVSTQMLAHPMLTSRVEIRILESAWLMDLQLPADRLEVAMNLANKTILTTEETTLTSDAVGNYIEPRILVHSSETPSEHWAVSTLLVVPPTSDKQPFWNVQVKLTPSDNADQSKVLLEYHVIGREIHTHEAVVVLVHDELKSNADQVPIVLSKLRAHRKNLLIER